MLLIALKQASLKWYIEFVVCQTAAVCFANFQIGVKQDQKNISEWVYGWGTRVVGDVGKSLNILKCSIHVTSSL